ncbi:oligosaccharide repeat unit polymerase [Virgibacillus halodenitrificans]|nr:oligosaccharide repeat unit polymerase [Virgibacillus halodenitrificans]
MGIYSTVLASILGIVIILNEFLRKKNVKPFDLLSGVNLLFFLSFVITPFSIYFLKIDFPAWTYLVDVNNTSPFIALLYVIIGYMALLVGVKFTKRCRFVKSLPNEFYIDSSSMEKFAHIIGILGVIFLAIFMYSVGGLNEFLSTNTLYRSGEIEVSPVAFVRNLALFIPISCQIFYGLSKNQPQAFFNRYKLFFIFYFVASLLLYFNRATRMGLLLFLISFFIINIIYYKKSLVRYLPVMGGFFVFFILFGKRIFNYFIVENISFQTEETIINKILGEFSFSFYSITNAVENSFFNGIPRLFFDFILGILNLLPSAFLPFNVPQTATQLNTESFLNMSGIPVDIISLGFYSFGVAGIILITFLFGALISILEKILVDKNNLMVVVFYVQFIFFVSLRVTYAGPTNVLKSNVCLFVAFLFFILFFRKKPIANKSNYQLKVGN